MRSLLFIATVFACESLLRTEIFGGYPWGMKDMPPRKNNRRKRSSPRALATQATKNLILSPHPPINAEEILNVALFPYFNR